MPTPRPRSALGRLPTGVTSFTTESSRTFGQFLRANAAPVARGATGPIALPHVKQWLALHLDGPYWMVPAVGKGAPKLPAQTQFLLWQRADRRYGILLPLVHGDLRATLGSSDHGVVIECAGALKRRAPSEAVLAFAGLGEDPYALVRDAMRVVSEYLGTFRLREQKPVPAFTDLLGWCTWDAFYHTVDARKVMWGLRTFARGGVRPGFVMLDDGWEDRDGDLLSAFTPHRGKFPGGFKALIARAKRDFGVRIFGIHHPFQGYWAGVNPKSKLGKRYRLVANRGCIRPWLGPKKDPLQLVHPDDIYRFYHDFYAFLRSQGADMVKVDGQSALNLFTEGKLGRGTTMRAYQEAQQGASAVSFGGQTIPCMSNGSDVLYNLNASNGWRNSTDYFPGRPAPVQQFHIYANAMNNLWSSAFAIPDWDMFQTHQPEAPFHAAARAISGGPIYVCDKPGKQDFELLGALCTSDSRLLRCPQPAQVCLDRIFVDTHHTRKLLKVSNTNGPTGVLGMFHVCRDTEAISDTYRASDVLGLQGKRFAAYHVSSGITVEVAANTLLRYALLPMGWELVTFACADSGVAAFGLIDKFNGSAAISSLRNPARGCCEIELRDGGVAGFWCPREPSLVRVDGKRARFTYKQSNGLLSVPLETGVSHVLAITL